MIKVNGNDPVNIELENHPFRVYNFGGRTVFSFTIHEIEAEELITKLQKVVDDYKREWWRDQAKKEVVAPVKPVVLNPEKLREKYAQTTLPIVTKTGFTF